MAKQDKVPPVVDHPSTAIPVAVEPAGWLAAGQTGGSVKDVKDTETVKALNEELATARHRSPTLSHPPKP